MNLNPISLLKLSSICAVICGVYLLNSLFANDSKLPLITEIDLAILEKEQSNHIVQKTLFEVKNYQVENLDYINNLNNYLKLLIVNNKQYNLQERVLEKLIAEEEFFYSLNKKLKRVSRQKIYNIPGSLSSNKMPLILAGAKELVSSHFDELLSGELLQKIHQKETWSCIYCNGYSWLATSHATFIKAALLSIIIELEPTFKSNFFVSSSDKFIQIFKLPFNAFSVELAKQSFNFVALSPSNNIEIAVVHNGYAYGGARLHSQSRDFLKNTSVLFDCSSWLAAFIQSDFSFTTLDLANLHRYIFQYGIVKDKQKNKEKYIRLNKILKPIKVTSISDLRPGMVFVVRKFSALDSILGNHDKKRGTGGHAGIILSVNPSQKTFLVASYGREMPKIDGLHIRNFLYEEQFSEKHFYFKIIKNRDLQRILYSINSKLERK